MNFWKTLVHIILEISKFIFEESYSNPIRVWGTSMNRS